MRLRFHCINSIIEVKHFNEERGYNNASVDDDPKSDADTMMQQIKEANSENILYGFGA